MSQREKFCCGLLIMFVVICTQGLIAIAAESRAPSNKQKNPQNEQKQPPNLLVIMVDQLNFRTLGCYREQLLSGADGHQQAYVWGNKTKVETPNIDSLAKQGALFTNFFTVSPSCTPSRASFMSGLYPKTTGSYKNNKPMHPNVTTWAQILEDIGGYNTAYVGKWHLNGDAVPGWGNSYNETRKFGFKNTQYQYNRGDTTKVFIPSQGLNPTYEMYDFGDYIPSLKSYAKDIVDETNYVTDFLFNKSMEVIFNHLENNIMKNNTNVSSSSRQPFAVMLSIPDPHPPYEVRPPYNTRFQNMTFQYPVTMTAALQKWPKAPPVWSDIFKNESFFQNQLNKLLTLYKKQKDLQNYFAMIQCIDDNVGKLLSFLIRNNLDTNTIVVFTSDHGGMMGEHALESKGKPYQASVGVPFLIRYPNVIPAGRVIPSTTVNIDFAPTILSLLGIVDDAHQINRTFHGQDMSKEWISAHNYNMTKSGNRTVFLTDPNEEWVAAVHSNYKLVLSNIDTPWFYDLERDPNELWNYYTDPNYQNLIKSMERKIVSNMKTVGPSFLQKPYSRRGVYWSRSPTSPPTKSCSDNLNAVYRIYLWNNTDTCGNLLSMFPKTITRRCDVTFSNASLICPDVCKGICSKKSL